MAVRSRPLVCVQGLSRSYVQRRGLSRETLRVQALDNIDLTISQGTTLALVGQSGSGKSTLARCLALLEQPSSGSIWFDERNLLSLSAQELMPIRRQIQLIFQDPGSALNPRFSAEEIVAEPLVIHGCGTSKQRRARALTLMEQVGLSPDWSHRNPAEFSGGQRQRLAIARALALEPRFLILDEALSSLDLSVQAQIINLLLELQAAKSLTYLYISHDLALAGHIADEVAVMHEGRIVERANPSDLFTNPCHDQSRALLASISLIDTRLETKLS